jgi:hypothetical protein
MLRVTHLQVKKATSREEFGKVSRTLVVVGGSGSGGGIVVFVVVVVVVVVATCVCFRQFRRL